MNKYIEEGELLDIYPKEWKCDFSDKDTMFLQYRNIEHFKNHCKNITQKKDDYCEVSYPEALEQMVKNKGQIEPDYYNTIKNSVKNNLLKRGLIADTVYESYKYNIEGSIVDVAKVIAEDPMCCLVPNVAYNNYFYELYINVAFNASVTEDNVKESTAKLLATIELLEREHIYIKITLVDVSTRISNGEKSKMLILIPLFSYKDYKDIDMMSAIINVRLQRKFLFAVYEDYLGDNLRSGYGRAAKLSQTINMYNLDEVELASNIIEQTIEKGTR